MTNNLSEQKKYARGAVTDRIQRKLVRMIKESQGKETLVAEDIIEAMSIGRNDPEGFRAVDKFLDDISNKYYAIENV